MIFTWIQAQAVKLLGGALGLALVALTIVMWRADSLSEQRDREREARVAEATRHAVTVASLATLEGELADMVRDGELRAERLEKALDEVSEETAGLREQAGAFDIRTVEGL